jgi:hypothetical protein
MTSNIPGNDMFIVSVDSRGSTPSDLTCYKEHTCSREFFENHIHDNPKNICVKSQVAGLCGLDLKLYFRQHSPYYKRYSDASKGHSPLGRTNGIATLSTFNPETGYYNHLVRGKAYVLLNDGTTPLSKRQVWGIQELIREAKDLYHQGGQHISKQAHMELLTWCAQYTQGTWTPHSIYEERHSHRDRIFYRDDSGMSDQATCHHGCTHYHHGGDHECCHNNELIGTDFDPVNCESSETLKSSGNNAEHARNYKFYNKICH